MQVRGRSLLMPVAVGVVFALAVSACSSSSTTSSAAKSSSSTTSSSGNTTTTSSSTVAGVGTPTTVLAQVYKGTFTQPPTTGPKAVTGKDVWVISCGQASLSCSTPANAIMQAGAVLGWKMHLYDAQLNPTNYPVGISQAIADGAQGIVAIAVTCNMAEAPLRQAKAAGIATASFSSFDCTDPNIHAGAPVYDTYAKYAKYNTPAKVMEAWGAAKAAWIIGATKGKAKVIDITTPTFLVLRYADIGFRAEMKQCKGCTIVDSPSIAISTLTGTGATQKLSTALQQYPTANALNVPNDAAFTEYANTVLKQVSRPSLKVAGGECFPQNIAEIRSGGPEDACDAFPEVWWGYATADELNRQFAQPGSAPVNEGLGTQLVDRTHNLPASGPWVPKGVTYIADYTKLWQTGKS